MFSSVGERISAAWSACLNEGTCFHHRGGQVGLHDVLLIHGARSGLGGEHLGAALAAEEDDPLVEHAQAADLDGTGGAHKGVGGDAVEVADVHGEEAPVEADGLHVDVHIEQLSLAGADGHSPVNGALGALGGVEAQILDTVLIPAGVEDFLGMDTDGLADTGGVLHGAGHNLFRHGNTSR